MLAWPKLPYKCAREAVGPHGTWTGPTEDLGIDVTVNPVVKGRSWRKL